jgi:hypothetical protein
MATQDHKDDGSPPTQRDRAGLHGSENKFLARGALRRVRDIVLIVAVGATLFGASSSPQMAGPYQDSPAAALASVTITLADHLVILVFTVVGSALTYVLIALAKGARRQLEAFADDASRAILDNLRRRFNLPEQDLPPH